MRHFRVQVFVVLHGSEHSHPRDQLPHVHGRHEGAGGDLLRPGQAAEGANEAAD